MVGILGPTWLVALVAWPYARTDWRHSGEPVERGRKPYGFAVTQIGFCAHALDGEGGLPTPLAAVAGDVACPAVSGWATPLDVQ